MSTARKYNNNRRSMSSQSRNSAYAAINILWLQMRPDLRGEDKETIRDERLAWFASFLGIRGELKSTKDLTDGQIGMVLDEMKRMTGQPQQKPTQSPFTANRAKLLPSVPSPSGADVIHLASEEQQFTAQKLFDYLGWTAPAKEKFLRDRFNCPNVRMLTFAKANSLMMILLNIAAHADLKSKGKKTGRTETAKHIKEIKRHLQIGD